MSWQCIGCRTRYADSIPACPNCRERMVSEHGPELVHFKGGEKPARYDAYPIRALRDMCRDRGLPVRGAKADLVTRLEGAA